MREKMSPRKAQTTSVHLRSDSGEERGTLDGVVGGFLGVDQAHNVFQL